MKPNLSNFSFITILVALNLLLAVYATPVTNLDDTNAYLALSKSFLGEVNYVSLPSRSPLYSMSMAGFMLIFKAPILYKVMIVFQYLLVAVTAWLVYLLFQRLFHRKEIAMLVALLYNLSFSTIYYANILLTETLSAFLLILIVFLLLQVFDRGGLKRIIALGAIIGLLSLTRFNAIPLIVTFFILLGYILFRREISLKKWFYSMAVFILFYAMVINLWTLYNYRQNGYSGLFPGARVGIPSNPRNITIASIRPGNIVSEANKPVLNIFLKARDKFLDRKQKLKKGSFARFDKNEILTGLYSGHAIYVIALPELQAYYKSLEGTNKSKITPGFNEFLREISAQNSQFIWKYRFYSLLSSLRAAAGGSLPDEYGNINLNFLPSIVFMAYKLAFLFISVFVFIAFFVFFVSTVKAKFKPDIMLLTMFCVIFSFWGINFVFNTVNDANRFKFPAEPLIIGLFVYYTFEFIKWLKLKKIKLF